MSGVRNRARRRTRFSLWPRGRWARARLVLFVGVPLAAIPVLWWIMIRMPGESYAGPGPRPGPQDVALAARIDAHVRALAVEIGPRHSARERSG